MTSFLQSSSAETATVSPEEGGGSGEWGHFVSVTPPHVASPEVKGPILSALANQTKGSTQGVVASTRKLNLEEKATKKTLYGFGKPLSPIKSSPSCPNLSILGSRSRNAKDVVLLKMGGNQAASAFRMGRAFGANAGARQSLSEATSTLFHLRRSGVLVKRGFHWRKKWVRRWVVLRGRMLSYYELSTDDVGDKSDKHDLETTLQPRGVLELSSGTLVAESSVDGKPFGFEIIPLPALKDNIPVRLKDAELDDDGNASPRSSGNSGSPTSFLSSIIGSGGDSDSDHGHLPKPESPIWYVHASSDEERRIWMSVIERSVSLIQRTESRPTLTGMGSVHDHYKIGRLLGVGRFGVVRAASNKRTRKQCAAKIINRKKHLTTELTQKIVENEIRLLRLMSRLTETKDHSNIMKVHEVYEDNFLIYIVVEVLSGGDLFDHIAGSNEFSEMEAASIMKGILSGVKVLHEVGIIHRDLKPENFLFKVLPGSDAPPVVKIADFGLSGTIRQFERHSQQNGGQRTVVGTPGYIAPEVITTLRYSTATDMYALGVILYTVLVGYPPIGGQKKEEVFRKTLTADWGFIMADWNGISSSARTLVGSMLSMNVSERITVKECQQFQWLLRASEDRLLSASRKRLKSFVENRKARKLSSQISIMATPPSASSPQAVQRRSSTNAGDLSYPVTGESPIKVLAQPSSAFSKSGLRPSMSMGNFRNFS